MTLFARPVPIFVGLGFPRDVESVEAAFEVLNEWSGSRGRAHAEALVAVRAALTGGSVSAAHSSFEAFVGKVGILAPEALEIAVIRAAEEWLSA